MENPPKIRLATLDKSMTQRESVEHLWSNSARLAILHNEKSLLSLHLRFVNYKMEIIIPPLICFRDCNMSK